MHFLKGFYLKLFFYVLAGIALVFAKVLVRPFLVKIIIDKAIVVYNVWQELYTPFFLYILFLISRNVFYFFQYRLECSIIPYVKCNIIKELMVYVQKHSYGYFQSNLSGNITDRIINIPQFIDQIIIYLGRKISTTVFSFIFAAIGLFFIHPIFSIILVIWTGTYVFTTFIFSKKAKYFSQKYYQTKHKISGHITDSFINNINVKIFTLEKEENKKLNYLINQFLIAGKNLRNFFIKVNSIQGMMVVILVAANLLALICLRGKNLVTVGDFGFIFVLNNTILELIWFLSEDIQNLLEQVGGLSSSISLLSIKHDVVDIKNAKTLKCKDNASITFKEVSFEYNKHIPIFNKLSVVIKKGEKIGIVGYSGAGKSTFINLIMRFFDNQEGEILINEENIKNYTQQSLRQNIAVIPQDPVLFHRTIYENIKIADPKAEKEEVYKAAKTAQLHDFILNAPNGYDTYVGERGLKLSGGQRQRLAIARVILKNAPIVIMDEATSSMDSLTEKYIHENLENIIQGKTTLVIAHRLSTLKQMDRILVFDNGKIVDDGTINELIKKDGIFKTLWKSQIDGFLQN